MKIEVFEWYLDEDLKADWGVRLTQGVQSFRLSYYTKVKEEAQWMAEMFEKALKAHDDERGKVDS